MFKFKFIHMLFIQNPNNQISNVKPSPSPLQFRPLQYKCSAAKAKAIRTLLTLMIRLLKNVYITYNDDNPQQGTIRFGKIVNFSKLPSDIQLIYKSVERKSMDDIINLYSFKTRPEVVNRCDKPTTSNQFQSCPSIGQVKSSHWSSSHPLFQSSNHPVMFRKYICQKYHQFCQQWLVEFPSRQQRCYRI